MPITLSTIEVVKQYRLDDGSVMTVVATQFNGHKARTFDNMITAPMSVPQGGAVEFHTKSWLHRAGVAAALSLKDCSLMDSETGEKIFKPSPNSVDDFLRIWFHPALNEVALTDHDRDLEFTYNDLIADAVYEANPQADPFPEGAKPPTSGEDDES